MALTTRRKDILCAESDIWTRQTLENLVVHLGHAFVGVADGESAVEQLNQRVPDLLILDVAMPKLGGFDVIRHLRKSRTIRRMPVILTSIQRSPEEAALAKSLGVTDFLIKPLEGATALWRIKTMLASNPYATKGKGDPSIWR